MKNLTIILLIAICSINAFSQGSPYLTSVESVTQDEADYLQYQYDGMRIYINENTVYVFDIENYINTTYQFSSDRDHHFLSVNDGSFAEGVSDNSYSLRYGRIEAGDTVITLQFSVDSMSGSASITRTHYIGRKRSDPVGLAFPEATESLTVFPNPVQDLLNIPEINESFTYIIYDMGGSPIIGGNASGNSLNLEILKSGNYILKLNTNSKSYSTKILKL